MSQVVSPTAGEALEDHVAQAEDESVGKGGLPTLPGLDVVAGLKAWQDEGGYRKALIRFGATRSGDGQLMRAALECGDVVKAKALAHALKGGAGNLAAIELAQAAKEVDTVLREGGDALPLVAAVEEAMACVVASCRQLALEDTTGVITRMLASLEEGDLEAVQVLLPVLTAATDGALLLEVNILVEQVEAFDFDAARETVLKIVQQLGLVLP